jgi:hypothetical protein
MKAFIDSMTFANDGREGLVSALKKKGFQVVFGQALPFTNRFVDPPPHDANVCFGSSGFIHRCSYNNLKVYTNFGPNDSGGWLPFEPHFLNADAVDMTVSQAQILDFPLFVKPHKEKLFTGFTVQSWEELRDVETSCSVDIMDQKVQLSSLKQFGPEARLFYVEGEFVTGSWYKGRKGEISDGPVVNFVDRLVQKEGPDAAFVIDIAETDVGLKIVELNNFNAAGLYDSDPVKLAQALYWAFECDPDFS